MKNNNDCTLKYFLFTFIPHLLFLVISNQFHILIILANTFSNLVLYIRGKKQFKNTATKKFARPRKMVRVNRLLFLYCKNESNALYEITLHRYNPILMLNNECIKFVDSIKFLGLKIDKQLNYDNT